MEYRGYQTYFMANMLFLKGLISMSGPSALYPFVLAQSPNSRTLSEFQRVRIKSMFESKLVATCDVQTAEKKSRLWAGLNT